MLAAKMFLQGGEMKRDLLKNISADETGPVRGGIRSESQRKPAFQAVHLPWLYLEHHRPFSITLCLHTTTSAMEDFTVASVV